MIYATYHQRQNLGYLHGMEDPMNPVRCLMSCLQSLMIAKQRQADAIILGITLRSHLASLSCS